MQQLMQHLRSGATTKVEVPAPALGPQDVWIATERTLISAGTERMLVSFGQANLLQKARQQPDKVAQVIAKMKTEGVVSTLSKVRDKLENEIPLGYCQTGIVHAVGREVRGIAVGDRVISNAPHADWAAVPQHLCARVPENVAPDDAVFTVLASISLHGIRLLQPTLGEVMVVSGLGMVGLMAVPLLRAQGCRVLALDYHPERLAIAAQYGAEVFNLNDGDPLQTALQMSNGYGVDGVLICAATDSDGPITQAAHMCRARGRIVLTGVAGLNLSRDLFYKKELSFQVSCSYGAGRYDAAYEKAGLDYPIAHVRWTEQRNFAAVLECMAQGQLNPAPLVSHRFNFAQVEAAYALLTSDAPSLGIVVEYDAGDAPPRTVNYCKTMVRRVEANAPTVAFIGAGGFASGMLMPQFQKAGASILAVASKSGASAAAAARKFSIPTATSDVDAILGNPEITSVVIATPHANHAALTVQALQAGKHVFVEKPLALSHAQLQQVQQAHTAHSTQQLMVGFNRRFAQHVVAAKKAMQALQLPFTILMTINAGMLPKDHWTRDPKQGGRLVGEGCHFVDLACFLADAEATAYHATPVGGIEGGEGRDGALISIAFANGCTASIHYLPHGSHSVPKERIELHGGGRSILLDNFRKIAAHGVRVGAGNLWKPNKGHAACIAAFLHAVKTGEPAADVASLFASSALTLNVAGVGE